MPVIIVATDFSPVATNAVHYACNLAVTHHASVHIVHSYFIPVTYGDTPMPLMPVDDGRNIAEESMNELTQQLKANYPALDIQSLVTYGDITDSLQDYTEKTKPWLIIVGNSSAEDTAFWLGSNLISELKDLPYPVVAIPEEAKYAAIENICFACDFRQVGKTFPAGEIISLVQQTGAHLHVLNVDHNNREFGTETPLHAEQLHEYLQPISPQYHYIDSADTEEGINNFINEHRMDWLLVIPHKHSFFEGLFRKSHTKAIARISHIPLVALHEK